MVGLLAIITLHLKTGTHPRFLPYQEILTLIFPHNYVFHFVDYFQVFYIHFFIFKWKNQKQT